MLFEFAAPARIVFGERTTNRLPALVREAIGAPTAHVRAVAVVGSSLARTAGLRGALAAAGIETAVFQVTGEPSIGVVRDGVARVHAARPEVVIAIGGGSVIDTAKAMAVLAANPGDVLDYLEVVGRGEPLRNPSIPVVAVPTTSGSGSEVTRNAVLTSVEHRVKASLRSATMLPRLAVVDPTLTRDLPPAVTASTGLDALTQVLEPFVSPMANPMTDSLARDALVRAARSLRRAVEHGDDSEARRDMSLTSLFGGLALANAKLGAVHGLAGVIGGMVESPHGAVCARLLPEVMAANLTALRERERWSPTLARYDEVARLLTGEADAVAEDGVAWVRDLCLALDVRALRHYGISVEELPRIADGAARASSTKGNPVELTHAELLGVLERAL